MPTVSHVVFNFCAYDSSIILFSALSFMRTSPIKKWSLSFLLHTLYGDLDLVSQGIGERGEEKHILDCGPFLLSPPAQPHEVRLCLIMLHCSMLSY